MILSHSPTGPKRAAMILQAVADMAIFAEIIQGGKLEQDDEVDYQALVGKFFASIAVEMMSGDMSYEQIRPIMRAFLREVDEMLDLANRKAGAK